MSHRPQVLILVHENDGYPDRQKNQIWSIAECWREDGLDVRVAHGPDDPQLAEGADLVIPHLDLTVTPPEYREWLDRQPRVLNRGVYDISKRAVSRNLVTSDDAYEGPVIVKTNFNYGGRPERTLGVLKEDPLWTRLGRKLVDRVLPERAAQTALESATVLSSDDYAVFAAKADVPDGVFDNPALVVEKFLPERRGELFLLRAYLFLGDRFVSQVRGSADPIVKGPGQSFRESCDPHPGILKLRRELGWDYGKFDYVVRDDQAVLLDANRTPGRARSEDYTLKRARVLAPGLYGLLGLRMRRLPNPERRCAGLDE